MKSDLAALAACSTVDSGLDPDTAPQTTHHQWLRLRPERRLGPGDAPSPGTSTGALTRDDESVSASFTAGTTSPGERDDDGTTDAGATDFGAQVPYPLGNTRITVMNGERALLVEAWYPADQSVSRSRRHVPSGV